MTTRPELGALRTLAPAKINWTLEVLGRRADGYHEIASVIQTVSLADELELRPAAVTSLTVEEDRLQDLPAEENLVMRTARAFPDELARRPVAFRLRKRIPAAAGLGGGSSDAAAALRLLAQFWGITDAEAVARAAAALGSDVPFFLRGGAQLARGRGEILAPLPAAHPVRLVIATPPIAIPTKTARLYAALTPAQFSDGAATRALARRLEAGGTPVVSDYVNVFDAVADAAFPDFADWRRRFERVAGTRPLLAGAGPSLFALRADVAGDVDDAALIDALRAQGFIVSIVATAELTPPSQGRAG